MTDEPAPDLRPGHHLGDLTLTDHAGNDRRLSDLIAGDPAIVHFYRGWWCPKEQTFFRNFRAGLGARRTFLCDPDRVEQHRLQLRETTDTVFAPASSRSAPASSAWFPPQPARRSSGTAAPGRGRVTASGRLTSPVPDQPSERVIARPRRR